MTMKLEDFGKVHALAKRRAELKGQVELVEGKGLGVTIQGRYQDDDMVDVARPCILNELQGRIDDIERELIALGVTP